MSQLEINLNVPPYFDDYDSSKKFYRILFRPTRSVQVRELNQVQTIIQEQVRRFGDHVFKDGSIVDGCNISYHSKQGFVRLQNGWNVADVDANAFDETLENFLVVSPTTGLRAVIALVKQGYTNLFPNTNTFYIDYVNTGRDGADNEIKAFISGELLEVYNDTQSKTGTLDINKLYNTINAHITTSGQPTVGITYAVSVGEGIVYQKGYFVNVTNHTITVKDYSTDVAGMLIGFDTKESIVTHFQDNSLIDPADTTNKNAPGGDRLKLNPVLVSVDPDTLTSSDEFFPIIEFGSNGKPVTQKSDPEYAKLGDVLAERTYENAGDFYTKPFIVSTEITSNTSNFNYTVSPGISYVKGNRVELLSQKVLTTPRATETEENNAQITTFNYGGYILVNELAGTFDFDQFSPINIYGSPQVAISGLGGSTSSAVGTVVGTANVRAVLHENGVKGTSDTTYRLYLTNIKMNSGKSFTSDAKSFMSTTGTFGNAKADIVLVGGKAALIDSSRSSLVFPMGIEGIKRLRSEAGVNDTQFYLRDSTQATLQANGSVTFTLNSPHAGGVERFFASPGVLSTANELRVDVTLSDNAVGDILAGTVDATTTTANNLLTGTGTTFTTSFDVGEVISINGNNRHIKAILSNTTMHLTSALAVANTAANYSKSFLAGQPVNMDFAAITVNSNTQFTTSLSSAIISGAPQTVTASYPVMRTQAVEAKKNVKKSRYVKIDASSGGGLAAGVFNLGLTDVYKIENVWVGTDYSESNPDRSSWFSLNNGQNDSFYDHAKLSIKSSYKSKITSANRILVKLSYFEADFTTGLGFFSVDSYPVINPGQTANTTNISYAEIPQFGGLELRNSIDLRPMKFNTAADATTIGAATINPDVSNTSFRVSTSGSYLAEPDSNFQADVEVYLPRIDLIQVSKTGNFSVKKSSADLTPKTPLADGDSAVVSEIFVPPYPSLTTKESYGTTQAKIQPVMRGNRVYTEKDIGTIDQRVTRLEYYQMLSLLETQAKDFTVKDENGLDRFKNGIFVDPFNNHMLGDVTNFEYNVAVDPDNSVLRPQVKKTDIDLMVSSSTGTKTQGSLLSIDYDAVKMITQKYASKYRNATESVWEWAGNISIFPSYDHFRDESYLPDINVTMDLTEPWDQFANSPFASKFGDWRVTNTKTSTKSKTSDPTVISQATLSSSLGNQTATTLQSTVTSTNTTTQTLKKQIDTLKVGSSLTTYDLGSSVSDFSINPFMRSRQVAIIVSGLKPSSNFFVFFDREAVSEHCAPAKVSVNFDPETGIGSITEGKESEILIRNGSWGSKLKSDTHGNLYALFRIPEGRFRVGDRELLVANVDDLTLGEDAIMSSAATTYTASSTTVTKRETSISTIQPVLTTATTTDTKVTTATNVTQRTLTSVELSPLIPWAPSGSGGSSSNGSLSGDPLGQTFPIEVPKGVAGVYLDKIGVYFRTKDANLGITMVLCEVTAGVPDTTKTISKAYLKPSKVNTSNTGASETVFDFSGLPFLSADKYYAFFLRPDGNSPEYQVWMSEIGGVDINTGAKIFTNPNIGVAVLSANSNSWNILQKEDVKFNVYRCSFKTRTAEVIFTEESDDYLVVDGINLANTSDSVKVGDVVYSQNSTGGLLTSNSSPYGIIQTIDTVNDLIVIDGSKGGLTANTTIEIHRPSEIGNTSLISSGSRIATTKIIDIDNIEYSMVVPRLATVTPSGATVNFSYRGTPLATGITDTKWVNVSPDYEKEFNDKMRVIQSRSNKVSGSDKNTYIRATLLSDNEYISPIIDLRRRNMFAIQNIINDSIVGETTRYGEANVKYISQPVVLAEGQDAEDINIFVTAYRPTSTDIHVYAKFLNGQDYEEFYNDKLWTKMEMKDGKNTYSSTSDVSDFKEFGFYLPTSEASIGEAWANASNFNIMQYRDAAGSIFVSFKTFAIKIVLVSSKPERVPLVDDVRAICLQR